MLGKRGAASRRPACRAQIAPSTASTVSYANDAVLPSPTKARLSSRRPTRRQDLAEPGCVSLGSVSVVDETAESETPEAPYAPLAAHLSHHENTDTAAANRPAFGNTPAYSPLYDFLKSRGVFELPPQAVCSRLVRLYFHHVHPFFPVIDASAFLDVFENIGAQKLSLHLLWSVFLAAANASVPIPCPGFSVVYSSSMNQSTDPARYEEGHVLEIQGWFARSDAASNHRQPSLTFDPQQALYDAEYERNKTTLIQAILLMGFWYADTEDRLGPWHWNGVAIGLCTSIGLHRQPDTSLPLGRQSSSDCPVPRTIWQQLWWACVFRETWLSAGMGRPARLNLAYSNTAKLDPRELGEAWEKIPISRRQKYFPAQMEAMIPLWMDLVDITIHQAEILSVQHRVPSVRQSTPEVERIEASLRLFDRKLRDMEDDATDSNLLLHIYHSQLFLDSALLTLYRPFMLVDLGILPPLDGDSSGRLINATKKSRTVAQHTNNILGNLIVHDMLKVSQALICIAIVPALLTHLLHASSAEKAARQLGWHYLALCMMAVEELRKTYFGAEILFKLFTRAQEKMQSQNSSRAVPSRAGSVAESPRRNTDQPRALSPPPLNTTWTAGGSSSLASPADNIMAENYDVEWILSQCMFPDLSSMASWDQQQDTTVPEAFNP
ncbi:C6 transcription factor [Colletotrichum higginsianum IMI 349063]|uniref:C6 transcription factor n=1 Tax=Colletotrichum higginsianum (strain IMI 349063) TaxID=759273 RepID=A0A1B7YLR5_COLHI|nr:C6 transcription factor [Colletotrichum higginsianum IMI 349063]OBR12969.1 C6 transcription factor [Colletotrichum higginsianum IMI 349063]